MNDVNLNSPDLKLVPSSEQTPARASVSPRADGRNVIAQEVSTSEGKAAGVTAASPSPQIAGSKVEQGSRVIDREDLGRAVSQLNNFVQSVQRDLQFEVDQELGKTIVKVVDQESQKIIRQIPDELALRLAENLLQNEPLTLFDFKV